ncbi:hypothetical protein ASG67_15520 [Sphingomonas sp. Leaf339]|nr:hypothetical protein ASG67_15520 [Sphingomonas sp. Leaf339]
MGYDDDLMPPVAKHTRDIKRDTRRAAEAQFVRGDKGDWRRILPLPMAPKPNGPRCIVQTNRDADRQMTQETAQQGTDWQAGYL